MNAPRQPGRTRRIAVRIAIGLGGLFLLSIIAMGIGYLRYGWHRLESLPSPATPETLEFRPYAEHGDVPGGRDRPYVVTIDPTVGGGAVHFFGSGHTGDPQDPQIDRIIAEWDAFRPTFALCESRLGLYIGGLRHGVAMFGEISVPFALARRDDIPVFTLEPDWTDEIAAMVRRFTPREVAAFYTMRALVSERGGRTGADLDGLTASLLAKRTSLPGLEGSFAALEEFDQWWDVTLTPVVGNWRDLPDQAMWPGRSAETLLTRLANASNRVRDEHLTRLIIERAEQGERVFVVCGASHALTIEPALRAALTP